MVACGPIDGAEVQALPDPLGSARSGLKGVYLGPGKYGVYLDQPEIVGNGLRGGYRERNIRVIADQGCDIARKLKSGTPDIPEQLFSLDHGSAFSCHGGTWSSTEQYRFFPRNVRVYTLRDDHLSVGGDAYAIARRKYNLGEKDLFLGKIDANIFFWEPRSPAQVYVRSLTGGVPDRKIELPRSTIDVLGGTRGVKKELCFVLFRPSSGLIHVSPHEFAEWETGLPGRK